VKELGDGRERENFVFVFVGVLCVECRGREERGKKTRLSWNEEKERILRFFFFSFFFRENAQTYTHTQALKGERTEYWVLRNRSIDQR